MSIEIMLQTVGTLLFVGCPFLIPYLLLKTKDKNSLAMIPEKRKRIASYRLYWKNPSLISKLSSEQRNGVEAKFFESVEKSRNC